MQSRTSAFDALPLIGGRALSRIVDPDSIDVRSLARRLWKRRWFIVIWSGIAGALVYLLVTQIAPTYSATAKVIIDTRKAQIITDNQVVADIDPSKQIVNGEMSVLRSNLLLGDVVRTIGFDKLDRLDPALAPETIASRAKSLLRGLTGGSGRGSPVESDGPSLMTPEELRTERLIGAIRRSLSVYTEADSFVIVIRIDTVAPDLAMVLANTIAERYIQLQLESRRDAVGLATSWLEERLADLKRDVETAEAAVSQFQAESLIRDGGTVDNTTQQLAELSSQLATARAARLEAEARHSQLEADITGKGLLLAAQTVSTPALESLRAQAVVLRQQDAEWAETFDANQPRRAKIQRELDQVSADMQAEVRNVLAIRKSELDVARIRENSLQDSVGALEARVMTISQNRLGLRQLEREASAARQTYETLLARTTETRIQKQLQLPDAKQIEQAIYPAAPSAPRPKLLAMLGGAVGAIIATALVFFNEVTAVNFRTARELETATGLPVLAGVPLGTWRTTRKGLRALSANPYDIYGERIRQLRTSVLMQGDGNAPRSILTLSSAPGEGKTMTTLALAEMAALAGKSVVVVDCDLRRSTIRKALGLKLCKDFVDFIEGTCTLGEAILEKPGVGFDVLASRGGSPGASEELSASWLGPMIEELKCVYDLVLIDAPALLAVSDGLILAPVVDSRIFIVGYDSTPKAAVLDALGRLQDLRLNISGLVLNKIDINNSPDAYAKGYSYEV